MELHQIKLIMFVGNFVSIQIVQIILSAKVGTAILVKQQHN